MSDTKIPLQQMLNMSKDISQGLENANAPSALNPFATIAEASGGGTLPMFSAGFAGDGSDGPIAFAAGPPTPLVFPIGGKQYTSMAVEATALVNASTSGFGAYFAGFVGFAKLGVAGRLTIDGTLNGTGAGNPGGPGLPGGLYPSTHLHPYADTGFDATSLSRVGEFTGSTGAGGGSGGAWYGYTSGKGGNGGALFNGFMPGGAGGAAVSGSAGNAGRQGISAFTDIVPCWWMNRGLLQSGTGGGGGGEGSNQVVQNYGAGGPGGPGGLTFVIECYELALSATGSIFSNGVNGGPGAPDPVGATGGGGGGGGSGGNILIFTRSIIDASGTISAARGLGGAGGAASAPTYFVGGAGGLGGWGRAVIVKV